MLQYCYRRACSINLGQSVVITGGWYNGGVKTVTQYSENGDANELPELITERGGHGCSSYTDSNNNMVMTQYPISMSD